MGIEAHNEDFYGLPAEKFTKLMKQERLRLSHYSPSDADKMMRDTSWTKAVVVRNPAERLLSAYLDKIRDTSFSSAYCFNLGLEEDCDLDKVDFSSFVDLVAKQNRREMNQHWNPQALSYNLQKHRSDYTNLLCFERLSTDTKCFLEGLQTSNKQSAWERYGQTGFGPTSSDRFPPNRGLDSHYAKHAKKKRARYYTEEILAKVYDIHAADYALFEACGWPSLREAQKSLADALQE